MADRVEMSFKNKEEKMWFTIMIPLVVIAFFAIFPFILSPSICLSFWFWAATPLITPGDSVTAESKNRRLATKM